MTGNNLQKPLQALSPMLDHIVTEAVGEHLPRKWWYCDSRALAFQDVSKIFKVGVSSTHDGMFQFESGNVCSADNLIGGVHVTGGSMGLRIADLAGLKDFC